MPVKAGFFDHQVMASPGEIAPDILDQHDDID